MTYTDRPGTKLVVVGLMMMVLGMIVPSALTAHVAGQSMTLPLALAIDGFKVGFYLGVALLIIGVRRNRKIKKDEVPHA